MPELPEVETVLVGIKPYLLNQKISRIDIHFPKLRWPIPTIIKKILVNQTIKNLSRRGKYLLLDFDKGTLIIHLGMSGRLYILNKIIPPLKHDHVDIFFNKGKCLRFTDPRRFGAILWTESNSEEHVLLSHLGPEPLSAEFDTDYLYNISRHKKVATKTLIMNSKILVGVGNIYATESLFDAKVHPLTPAGKLTKGQCAHLVVSIKKVLKKAIKAGGTTLKDFVNGEGNPGYFSIELNVYGRAGEPCTRCHSTLKSLRIGQRSTVFCPKCQQK